MEVMNPERWKKLEEIFQAASPMNLRERRAFLDQACVGNEDLRREAESLLAADSEAVEGFLQGSAFTLGMQVLASDQTRRTEMALLPVGMILDGRFKILEPLDAGGMGEVYKAEDLDFKRSVAVKVLKKTSQQNPWIVEHFEREGGAQGLIGHSNVATVLAKGSLPNGQPYLVVEFVKGKTLQKEIEADQALMAVSKVKAIMEQVCDAVTVIHNAGFIHRDLKPENIMVYYNVATGKFEVKVIDFGIVRVLDKNTVMGMKVGTPLFMSPEQKKGQEVTFASDVYALGLIANVMLMRRHPFDPDYPEQPKNGVKVKPHALRSVLQFPVKRVIRKALADDPGRRQQSAREFFAELLRAMNLWRPVAATAVAVALVAFIVGSVLWWSPSGHALQSTEVAGARIESQPANGAIAAPANPRVYDAEASFPTGPLPKGMVYATIGFTVWRTRPAMARDGADAARETIDSQEMASERIADSLADGDRLYLGIESLTGAFLPDKGGYLYVINREQYADGTFGRARLIFPTLLTYDGQNRVRPGEPIVLPDTNRPFIIKRSSPAQVAETYTIILSPWKFPLPKELGTKAMELPDNLVADWEKQYGGWMYRARLRGGVGQARTKREQTVGSRTTIDTAEPLTQNEPVPQSCYRGAVKSGNPAMVTVALRFKD